VSRGRPRRRLRVRRRRKGESFASKAKDAAADAAEVVELPAEVVGHLGCCVFEAVGSMAVLVALLSVPAYLLLR
jgi:hypothetical protein